jgi:hypothetical protein
MGGKNSGVSRKRRTLPKHARPGWLTRMDQRSAPARAMHESLLAVGDQLGGDENITPIARMLLTRLIHADALAQTIEETAREGKAIDVGQYLAITDRVQRLGTALGLARRAKPVENLHGYMARKAIENSGGSSAA